MLIDEMGNRNTSGLKVEENTDDQEKPREDSRLDDVKEQNVGSPAAEDEKDLKKIENGNSDEKDEENKKGAVQEESLQETEKTILNHVKGENNEAGNENAHVGAEVEILEKSEAEKQNQKLKEEDNAKDEAVVQAGQETARENDAEIENHVTSAGEGEGTLEKEAQETGGESDPPKIDPENKEESQDDSEKREENVVVESSEQSLQETSHEDDAKGENDVVLTAEVVDQEKGEGNPRSESVEIEAKQTEAAGEEEDGKIQPSLNENAASPELATTESSSEKNEKECRIEEVQTAEDEASEEQQERVVEKEAPSPNPALTPAEEQDEDEEVEPKEKRIAEEIEGKTSDSTNKIHPTMQKSPSFNLGLQTNSKHEESEEQTTLQFQDKATIETSPNQANDEKEQDYPKNDAVPVKEKVVTFLGSSKDAQEEARNMITPKKEENHDAATKKTIVSVKEVSSSLTKGKEKRRNRPPLFFGTCMCCAPVIN